MVWCEIREMKTRHQQEIVNLSTGEFPVGAVLVTVAFSGESKTPPVCMHSKDANIFMQETHPVDVLAPVGAYFKSA